MVLSAMYEYLFVCLFAWLLGWLILKMQRGQVWHHHHGCNQFIPSSLLLLLIFDNLLFAELGGCHPSRGKDCDPDGNVRERDRLPQGTVLAFQTLAVGAALAVCTAGAVGLAAGSGRRAAAAAAAAGRTPCTPAAVAALTVRSARAVDGAAVALAGRRGGRGTALVHGRRRGGDGLKSHSGHGRLQGRLHALAARPALARAVAALGALAGNVVVGDVDLGRLGVEGHAHCGNAVHRRQGPLHGARATPAHHLGEDRKVMGRHDCIIATVPVCK
jgi:hypothetical protein